ncbi:cytochrome b5 domain-containing protein [Lacrimispora sp.]|uniref:cytochrome b5 domain-containing protein n=1 Tax=Lacrimispora sp. TaxID=2719234 RepID=UPI00345F35F9
MELNLFLDFVSNSVRKISSDAAKLHLSQGEGSHVLDRLNSEAVMLEHHIRYFIEANQLGLENLQPPYEPVQVSQTEPEPEEEVPTRYFTLEELAAYNGKNGAPAYVAVHGVVYDVTNNSVWRGGPHFGMEAGNDITEQFNTCHPGARVLQVLPVVGYLY